MVIFHSYISLPEGNHDLSISDGIMMLYLGWKKGFLSG
jgi:hypothetical protein